MGVWYRVYVRLLGGMMNISTVNLQQKNPAFDFVLTSEAGPVITVLATMKQPVIEVSKTKSVLDHVEDIAKVVVANIPPNAAGIALDIAAVDAARKDLAVAAADSDTSVLLIPAETLLNHHYTVRMQTVVTSLTMDTGANEYADTSFFLQWDGDDINEMDRDSLNSEGKLKLDRVRLALGNLLGTGSDSAELTIIRRVGTDGAIFVAPCISRVSLAKIKITILEAA